MYYEGLRVAIVPQPDWRGDFRDFKKLGTPRLFFGISPGAMDSMINHSILNQSTSTLERAVFTDLFITNNPIFAPIHFP